MAGMHKAVSERHGMTTIAALVAIVAMIFASVIAAPQRAYAEGYNISDLGWVDKDDTSFEISSDGGKTWKPYISGMQVNYGDQIRTELHWKVPNDVKINEGDTFVYDLPSNLEYKSNEKYPIYNGGDVVGYYTIDGDKMVATYTRGESAGSNIEAFVTTDGTITSNKTGGSAGGDTSFTFPGYGTITVNVEGKHRVNVVKRPAISTSDASTYDFVLEVTSTGTNTGVTIDDTMGGLLTFVDGSVHIYTDADCKNEYTGAWQSSKTDDHNFNVTIGSMGDGEKLYVRYSVNADKDSVIKACREAGNCSNATENKNKVTYSSNEDVNKKETSNSIWFNYSDWYVNKSATAAKDENGTQGFTWNITIGAGEGQSVDGATVKDLLDKNNLKEPTGDLVLSCYNSGDWKSVCPPGAPGAYQGGDQYNPQHYIKLSWSDLVAGTVTLPLRWLRPFPNPVLDRSEKRAGRRKRRTPEIQERSHRKTSGWNRQNSHGRTSTRHRRGRTEENMHVVGIRSEEPDVGDQHESLGRPHRRQTDRQAGCGRQRQGSGIQANLGERQHPSIHRCGTDATLHGQLRGQRH